MDRNLRAFLAVADKGNLTAAAETIGLAQPSLSKRLANLEGDIGAPLFIRHRRGMELTTAGKLFYGRAKRIEQEYFQAREELRGLDEAGLDVLRVGAGPLFNLLYVAPAFTALRNEFPGLRLELLADTNNHTLPLLESGRLDVVLGVIEASKVDDSIALKQLTTVEHGVVVASHDPLSRLKMARPEDLTDRQWLFYSDDPETERWLTGYFVRQGFRAPQIVVRTSSFASGLDLVRRGGFVMMAPVQLSRLIAASDLRAVRAYPPITQLPAGAYARTSSLGFRAVARFIELVASELRTNGPKASPATPKCGIQEGCSSELTV